MRGIPPSQYQTVLVHDAGPEQVRVAEHGAALEPDVGGVHVDAGMQEQW